MNGTNLNPQNTTLDRCINCSVGGTVVGQDSPEIEVTETLLILRQMKMCYVDFRGLHTEEDAISHSHKMELLKAYAETFQNSVVG